VAADVAVARFEEVAARRPSVADRITVRAVRVDKALSDTTLRLLRPSGRMILFETVEHAQELVDFQLIESLRIPLTGSVVRVVVPRGTKD
jgi:16S rRNA G527 N7-methylase RsmG